MLLKDLLGRYFTKSAKNIFEKALLFNVITDVIVFLCIKKQCDALTMVNHRGALICCESQFCNRTVEIREKTAGDSC